MPDTNFAPANGAQNVSSAVQAAPSSPQSRALSPPAPPRAGALSAAAVNSSPSGAAGPVAGGAGAESGSESAPEQDKDVATEVISTVERIARYLEDGIVFGTLAPRERIQELKVAGDLGVSRGSVREALLVLEGRHLVSILPRRGALVRPLNNSELASIAEVIAQVTGTLFVELASRRPTAISLASLKDGLQRISLAVDANDVPALIAARQAYFELPKLGIDNDFSADLLRGLSGSARRLMLLASHNSAFDPADTRRCAQALFDATSAHDSERIRQVLQAMLRRDVRLASG